MNASKFSSVHDAIPLRRKTASGFTMVEMLAVVGLMVVLLAFTLPAVGGMTDSSRRTKYLNDVSALFEGARQYAVANNTYVWVAFGNNATSTQPLYACMIASADGLAKGFGPDDAWSSETFTVTGNANFRQLGRLMDLGPYELTSTNGTFSDTAEFSITKAANNTIALPRSVQFSPRGEARISGGIQGSIAFRSKATEGRMKEVVDEFSLSGPTGFLQFAPGVR